MGSDLVYRTLVPDAPIHRRTEYDLSDQRLNLRRRPTRFPTAAIRIPGLQDPSLISSFSGSIDRILFCFPAWAPQDPALAPAYQSVISALRKGTKFIVAHHESALPAVQAWFDAAGHAADDVTFVGLPDYVNLTDWAEDAYVALTDMADGSVYLVEPWEFRRAGDALIADAVEERCDVRATQAPLIFQGGNCLIGDRFWYLGKDYFADTIALLTGSRPPVQVPDGTPVETFAEDLFRKHVDARRQLTLIGINKALSIREYIGRREGNAYYLDIPANGVGSYQPIFHIDMFITLVGPNPQGIFEVLVGSPAEADKLLGTKSPYALNEVYDAIAADLTNRGVSVRRNPLVHRSTIVNQVSLKQLKDLTSTPGYEPLVPAVQELDAAGASAATRVQVRDYYHITWNNCLVENSATFGKHVYLPTFGHGPNQDLRQIDCAMTALWEQLGFTVHALGDFDAFARRQGVVHCIKKYVGRGN
jgi:hypothetical protein